LPATPVQSVDEETYALQLLETAKNWPVVALDSFDTNSLGWREGQTTSESLGADHKIENGHYAWALKGIAAGSTHWIRPTKVDPPLDFYVSVDALRVNDLNDLRLGIIFRDQGTRVFYDFMIYMDGHFIVQIHDDNDTTPQSTANLIFLPTTKVNPMGTNKLGVVGIGKDYWFYVNDEFVYHLNNTQLSGGTTGLIAGVKEIGQEARVEFDNFELRRAP